MKHNTKHLNISVRDTNLLERECYNVSFDYNAENLCNHFNCSTIELVSSLAKGDEDARVHVNRSSVSVFVEPPDKCGCTTDSTPSSSSPTDNSAIILAATIPSLVIGIALFAVAVVIILYYTKIRKLKEVNLDE